MIRLKLLLLIIWTGQSLYSQCLQEPEYFPLDNSTDTIFLTGRCGNPLDEPDTGFLEPENFGYFQVDNNFLIDCAFAKNCARVSWLTIQANDSLIRIYKYEVDTGEATTCEAYERFIFWFPLPPEGYFRITVNAFDTTVTGLSSVTDPEQDRILIYPNPCKGEFVVHHMGFPINYEITMINTSGEIILREYCSENINAFNVSRLGKGLYFIRIQDRNSSRILHSEKLIKLAD